MTTLEAEYERVTNTPSDIWEHLPQFVRMVNEVDAYHVIELGTRSGVSTIAWLYALEGKGRLTSVDIDPKPAIGDWPHWTFIQGDDCDPDVLSQLPDAEIVFVDTSHFYEHTVKELNIYRHLVKPGGLIVCHDTQLRQPLGAPSYPAFPVRKAMVEFAIDNGYKWGELKNCWGLGWVEVI